MTGVDVQFVLVRPGRAANVAAACRALANMGVGRLAVVEPAAWPRTAEERGSAYGAWELLDGARRCASLQEALADEQLAVATSGRAEGPAWSPAELAAAARAQPAGTRLSVVFGPERTGLRREELQLCHALVRIPTAARQPSLNLAQAALLVAYELFVDRGAAGGGARAPWPRTRPAHGALEAALAQWRAALLAVGYLPEQDPERLLAELRRLLTRARPSARELALLRGVARQVAWAGDVARARRRGR
jgi:TrmH family RNA methyltransferase